MNLCKEQLLDLIYRKYHHPTAKRLKSELLITQLCWMVYILYPRDRTNPQQAFAELWSVVGSCSINYVGTTAPKPAGALIPIGIRAQTFLVARECDPRKSLG
jgi:hypothetical protein